MRKKKKINNSDQLKSLQSKIIKNGDKFDIPKNMKFKNINSHSWFDIKYCKTNKLFADNSIKNIKYDDIESDGYRTRQIKLLFTNIQKKFIDKWLDMYILMYNATIKQLKKHIFNKNKIPNLTKIKKELKNEKDIIRQKSILKNNKKQEILMNSHTLDYAINDALNMYAGNMTKLKNKSIKHFRLRYIKINKPNKILKVERIATKNMTFFKNALGEKVKCSVKNFNYTENVKTVAIITKRNNEYYMLLKYKQKIEKIKNNNLISIDPGIRTVITGYSTNGIVEIGTNVSKNLKMRLLKIDNIQSKFRKNIDEEKTTINKKGLKIMKKKYEKIKNRINDMHWKIIKYLTLNKNILFGNFSTKKMGENKGTHKMTKRIGNSISFFQLKQKLKYMCNKKEINYKEVDERFTTQCCGKCGNQKKDIGSDKIYKCDKCKSKIKRDINSARLILITETK